ncbi:MAG: lipocalin family protein [Bacteroidota bacterium]|nr:lipocalin family protein [Bacteroidota bacterium]
MKKFIVILAVLIVSCNQADPKEQLKNLNGYWEIDHVELEKDSVIKYGMSPYIDYIELKDSIGFRKKLKPEVTGEFIATENEEKISAKMEGHTLKLKYSTPYDQWEEEVLQATEENLVLMNSDGKTYYYKRYKPVISQENEEKE